ncbi:MAG: hypothetical protein IJK02_06205 [Clostridia bacterium]|nr:hypothetical protein [Clostridia bacterium]
MAVRLTDRSDEALRLLDTRARAGLENVGRQMKTDVQGQIVANGSVRTGRMLGSVGASASERTVTAGVGVYYAKFVELGHRIVRRGRVYGYVPAKAFFRPAIERGKAMYARLLESALRGKE